MNGFTHKVGGICSGVVTASLLNIQDPKAFGIVVVSSAIGSLFPDIDEPNSTVGKKVKPVSWSIKKIFGHRGIIHTPIFCALIVGLLYFLHTKFAPCWIAKINYEEFPWMLYINIGIGIGYISHLFLDLLTPQGIMLLFPISTSYITIMGWKNKNRDIICTSIMTVATVIFLLLKYNVLTITANPL